MEVIDNRKYKNCKIGSRTYCIGKLTVDGVYICDTIEDKDWGWDEHTSLADIKAIKSKNKSLTAIPHGRYRVRMDRVSPKFSKKKYYMDFCKGRVPYLSGVPGFDGILIHTGNTERASAGCIIVGYNTIKGQVTRTQAAFEKLYGLLKAAHDRGEEIYITIK